MSVSTAQQENETTEDWHLSSHRDFESDLGEVPTFLSDLRQRGLNAFREQGFPTTRLEEWKYTSTRPIRNNEFRYTTDRSLAENFSSKDLSPFEIPDLTVNRIVFVDGFPTPHLSSMPTLPDNVVLTDLETAIQEHPEHVKAHLNRNIDVDEYAFGALNSAFLRHGAFLYVPENVVVEDPIHVFHITSSDEPHSVTFPRNLFVVEDHSEVSIIEHYADTTGEEHLTNAATELSVARNGSVDHYKLNLENRSSCHVYTFESDQKEHANVSQTNIHFGSHLARNDINATLDGEGGYCALNGLFCTKGDQHVDNHTRLYHMQPNCDSYELYTGVMDDQSTGVFNGTIYVHKRAQRTSSNQHNNNLLLTNDAKINTKPELEIFADDVTCSHGATIGQLEERAKYYLRTRGIEESFAQEILINAFARDLTDRIAIEPLREMVNGTFYSRRDTSIPSLTN